MSPRKTILLIEDETDLVKVLSAGLEKSGWRVLAAYDGEEGLKKANEVLPDLILLDVMMPRMNGFQVCHDLKTNPRTKKIPVIMLTVRARANDKSWGIEVGACDYIIKPFTLKTLKQHINAHL